MQGRKMRRREFITLLAGAAGVWPLTARAQHPKPTPHVVHLSPVSIPAQADGIRNQLRDLGYVEGQNIHLEFRDAAGNVDELSALAERVVKARSTPSLR